MGLLEIVKNENNDLAKINSLKNFCEKSWAKELSCVTTRQDFLVIE